MLKPSRCITASGQQLLATRAQDMRRFPTAPELVLWRALRANRLGIAFRRQVVLGNRYIADFVALSLRLVVEVDGAVHALQRCADARRDRDLVRLRVPARLVLDEFPAAVALMRVAIEARRETSLPEKEIYEPTR
jgi:very-short-patch-repair endonuclease